MLDYIITRVHHGVWGFGGLGDREFGGLGGWEVGEFARNKFSERSAAENVETKPHKIKIVRLF